MNYPAACCGVSRQEHFERNCRIGGANSRAEWSDPFDARSSTGKPIYFLTIVSDALLVIPPREADIVTTVFRLTVAVVMLKVAVVLPAATVAVEGTAAFPELLLDKFTTKPPVGAGAVSVTVPTEVLPPRTVVG